MSLETIVGILIAISTAGGAVLGWLYKTIWQKVATLEIEAYKRTTFKDVREMVADKMAPIQSEYLSLTRRIDEIKQENDKMNEKIDELLIICTKLSNQK